MDLDGDGNPDVISGSWPGELYWFRGTGPHTFAGKDKLLGADGHAIKPHDSNATAVCAVDWDDDGDVDLIVGDIRGRVSWVENTGSPSSPRFAPQPHHLMADGRPLVIEKGTHSGPAVADWDLDGDLDLIVGDGWGKVSLFENVGTRARPTLKFSCLLVDQSSQVGGEITVTPTRGSRTKVDVADWDGDGLPDLLMGDFSYLKVIHDHTPEQQAEFDRLQAQYDKAQESYQSVVGKLRGVDRTSPEGQKLLQDLMPEITEMGKKLRELRAKLPKERSLHGWVWLFKRRPR